MLGGALSRLTPVELERLDDFPPRWTVGMTDNQRAFCMGNALVVGVVERIGRELGVLAKESKPFGRTKKKPVGKKKQHCQQ